MQALSRANLDIGSVLTSITRYLTRPVQIFRTYEKQDFRQDLVAGLTLAIILLPQGIAFAIIAELPPQMGLYAAIVGAIFGALWGSSDQLHTGPTNAHSLLVASSLGALGLAGGDLMIAAGLMSIMAGLLQFMMGIARLGVLVNFVSYSVIVGFASGAGVLIAVKQVLPFLGLSFPNDEIYELLWGVVINIGNTHWQTAVIGLGTILIYIILRRINRRLPSALISMLAASVAVYLLRWEEAGVDLIGELPSGLPPVFQFSAIDLELIARLSTGSLAVAAIGLVQTIAITRSLASQTGQRLDSNQEFVGQGLANIVAGLLGGYSVSGSFSRSALAMTFNAQTAVAALLSGVFLFVALPLLVPLTAYLPRTALAGVLIVTAYNMIDRAEIKRILQGTRGDAIIMVVTFLATLFLTIEFAVLAGILLSFARYIMRTSTPRVEPVFPDKNFEHFEQRAGQAPCPQLGILEIHGDLYFGAVNHIEEEILAHSGKYPEQRFLLLRMNHVNQCDFSGINMLESVIQSYRDRGGDVYLARINERLDTVMHSTGCKSYIGEDNIFDDDRAIGYLFQHELDPAVCIYECPERIFKECQNLPKRTEFITLDEINQQGLKESVTFVAPEELWQELHPVNGVIPLTVIDVREPREFRQGHIAEASSYPLSQMLEGQALPEKNGAIVLVCRSGRRSQRAASILQQHGFEDLQILQGGMLAWQAAHLLEAVE